MNLITPSALAVALSVTITGSAATRTSKPDAYIAVGESVNCIGIRSYRSTHVRDDKTVDFEINNRTIYRNNLPYNCPGLGNEKRFVIETSQSQLCSVDTIGVVQDYGGSYSVGARCGLGKFQRMEKPRR